MARSSSNGAHGREYGFGHWFADRLVAGVDHRDVVEKVCDDSGWSAHFAFMTLMSAGIAMLGLLLNSPAVVIGAMLISPLMGPIIGLGFALAIFDHSELRRSALALALGSVMAVAFCALIVLLSPLQTLTAEIAARTRPNLFDLLVALFSGLAGTYSMIRGRHGTIAGVAIATALMPPLGVVGFGLATLNWTVLGGSTLLFFTNLTTIAASAAILARLYGFAADLSPHQTRLQATIIVAAIAAFAVPLALALKQIAWETVAYRQVRDAFADAFGAQARLTELDIDYDSRPIEITATVLTPRVRAGIDRQMGRRISELLGRRVEVAVDQLRIENGEAESAEIASARGAPMERTASRIADRLALIGGVAPDQVLVDVSRRRAIVDAAPLAGADLETYRILEARASAAEPGWRIMVVPPFAPLHEIEFDADAPSSVGEARLTTALWAAQRLRLPVVVSSGQDPRAEAVAERFRTEGVQVDLEPGRGDNVRIRWAIAGAGEDQ